MEMEKMLSAYDDLTNPVNIRSHFKTDEEFIWWLEMGTKDDLDHVLKVFENVELYEDCALILKMINSKKRCKN
jgi:hypothetical protein